MQRYINISITDTREKQHWEKNVSKRIENRKEKLKKQSASGTSAGNPNKKY